MTSRDAEAFRHRYESLDMVLGLLGLRVAYLRVQSAQIPAVCRLLGPALHLSPPELGALALAARFHHVGLLAISDSLLEKEGQLTREEKALVDRHSDLGASLTAKLFPALGGVVDAIRWHHERPDGKGPHGLRGEQIPVLASCIGLADALESMANGRPHRPSMSLAEILDELQRNRGTQFAPQVVDAFRRCAEGAYRAALAPAHAPTQEDGTARARAARTDESGTGPQAAKSPPSQPEGLRAAPQSHPSGAVDIRPWRATQADESMRALQELTPLITGAELSELIQAQLELKALAPAVQEVVSLTVNPRCSLDDVAKAVAADPGISVRLLRLANSCVYARGRPVDSVKMAVQRIGMKEVQNLVMTLDVVQQYGELSSSQLDIRMFWEHSFACGVVASALAREREFANADLYFLWGVLHDVGRLVLLAHAPEAYARVLDQASELSLPVEVVENKLLTTDHGSVAKQVLEAWRFPTAFIAPPANHHARIATLRDFARADLESVSAVALADRIAHFALLGNSGNDTIYPLEELLELLHLKPETVTKLAHYAVNGTRDVRIAWMAKGNIQDWPDFAGALARRFPNPVRALCVGDQPSTTAYQVLFDRLSDPVETGPPNLGVICLRHSNEQEAVLNRYETAEREAGVPSLPLIVMCQDRKLNMPSARLKSRSPIILYPPVRISTLMEAIEDSLR
ncbi:MAG TPA: HDOD domain-containing protein [Phycisphaerae bacterium]|nr:HDOD domain-containing protein [Phycisphaerae bacterium]